MKTLILLLLVILICVYKRVNCSCRVCTNIDQISHLLRHNSAMAGTYKVFKDFGLLRCVQQCMFRSRCQSINFDVSTKICELNEASSSGLSVRNGSVTTSVTVWPRRLARLCENVYCTPDQVCVIEKQADRETVSCVTDISPVDQGYIKATNLLFYYKPYTDAANYDDANNICHNDGARIIEPDTEEKKIFIIEVIRDMNVNSVFIGARDVEDIGDWRWVSSNSSLTFTNWYSSGNEPQTGKSETCAAYYNMFSWNWANIPCSWNTNFVCEIPI